MEFLINYRSPLLTVYRNLGLFWRPSIVLFTNYFVDVPLFFPYLHKPFDILENILNVNYYKLSLTYLQ